MAVSGQVGRYRTVRRLVEGRWNGAEAKALRATPRMPRPGQEEEGGNEEGGHLVGPVGPRGALTGRRGLRREEGEQQGEEGRPITGQEGQPPYT